MCVCVCVCVYITLASLDKVQKMTKGGIEWLPFFVLFALSPFKLWSLLEKKHYMNSKHHLNKYP